MAEPAGLKLCFLWLQANAMGHTFLSPQIPPASDLVGSGVQNNGRARAEMLAHLQAAVKLSSERRGKSKGRVNGRRQALGASPVTLLIGSRQKNYLVSHQNNLETSFVFGPQ